MTPRLTPVTKRLGRLGLVLALGLMSACSSVPQTQSPQATPAGLKVTYLGTAGYILEVDGKRVATAPFASNSNPFQQLGITPHAERIDARVPDLPDVEWVLLGHTHYDHALDLPYLAGKQLRNATLIGSTTMTHLLAPVVPKSRMKAVDSQWASASTPGKWLYSTDRKVRLLPLESDHAPHILGMKVTSSRKLTEDLTELPSFSLFWPEGETLAYLIDFLSPEGKVRYRIFYQDSASSPGKGHIPAMTGDEAAPVDLALLVAPSFTQVENYPEHMLANLKPRHVVAGHWESFLFGTNEPPASPIPLQNYPKFAERVKAASGLTALFLQPGEGLSLP